VTQVTAAEARLEYSLGKVKTPPGGAADQEIEEASR
jgi:hypothetical protein